MHNDGKHLWSKETWEFPLIHEWDFTFGLSMDDATKTSTIVPYIWQDNALIDYETIKTNPRNADFAIIGYPNSCLGSYIPNISVTWQAFIPPQDTEVSRLHFNTMGIHTAMKNRLEAFDVKTGTTTASILELQSEATDRQVYPIYDATKLFESQGARDVDFTKNIGLTTDGQLENVAFDKDLFFNAMHYYSNKEMLKSMTTPMKTRTLTEPIVSHKNTIAIGGTKTVDSMCKLVNDYTFQGELFHLPQVDSLFQYHTATETTAIEHVTVKGHVSFNEFNGAFNFAVS